MGRGGGVMDVIKFRAWHHGIKHMYKVVGFNFKHGTVSMETDGHPMVTAQDNVVIEQYTGLKDKNGDEIYEGDIVSDFRCMKFKVIFKDSAFCLKQLNCDYYEIIAKYGSLEVVGNIHESEV
jgi:uncharacterized phage protein (TIGR01671 family)